SSDGSTLYVALSNRDSVAKLDISAGRSELKGYIDTRLPGQSYFGAGPEALALTPNGNTLYVADMNSNAVAVVDTTQLTRRTARKGMIEPIGFVPTEWMPMCVRFAGGKLYIATGKGRGAGPNDFPQQKVEGGSAFRPKAPFTYLPTLLYGSLATVETAYIENHRSELTQAVLVANRMNAAKET